jgi:AcrR family transcriptional regulator
MSGGVTARSRRAPARRGQGAALREDILAAATGLIARSGDAGTLTLRAVAREVGVAATSIYLHFDSVEALLAEVKECRFGELAQRLASAADAAGSDPVARVRARCHAYVLFGNDRPGEYAVMFAARLVPPDGAPDGPRFADTIFDEVAVDLRVVERPGRPPMTAEEARMVCFHLWTALHGMVSLRLLRRTLAWPDAAAQVDDLVDRLVAPAASASTAAG